MAHTDLLSSDGHFNSRPHEEVDDFGKTAEKVTEDDFNSRPHEEVDYARSRKRYLVSISTHDLTRRSTKISICMLVQ